LKEKVFCCSVGRGRRRGKGRERVREVTCAMHLGLVESGAKPFMLKPENSSSS